MTSKKPRKKKADKKPTEDRPSVMVVCVNNSGFRNEYSCNAMYGMGWVLGSAGIKTLSYTFDAHPICYDDKTEILTENGFKLFKDLDKTEKVATLNPKTEELEYQLPKRIISMSYQGKMFKIINSRKVDLVVTPNHKMFVSKYKSANDWYPFELIEAKEIINKKVRYKRDAIWNGVERECFYLPALLNAKRKDQRTPREIPMDIWLEFFGYWIAEGCTSKYTKSGHYTTTICQFKSIAKRKKIRDCIGKLFNFDEATYGHFRINNKQLWSYLKQFGHAPNKFIPKELLQLSSRQLKILLEAMMLGDGFKRERITIGSVNESLERGYTTTSERLGDDTQEILLKIGISGNVRILESKGKQGSFGKANYDEIIVRFVYKNTPTVNERSQPNRARNDWVDYNGQIYCVEVPNHIIYVRRNGIPVWSGNSLARNEAVKEFLESPFKFTHLFFIDSDSVPKADIIIRLLQHQKPVASGWYLDRGGHGLPVVLKIIAKNTPKCVSCLVKHPEKFPEWRAYKLDELLIGQKEKKSSLVKVDGVGAGCLLIERGVFSKLEKPYFYEDHLSVHSFGEDLWFGLNCKVHRIPIYVDLNALVEHWSWGLIGERHVKALLQKSIRDKMQAKSQGKPI